MEPLSSGELSELVANAEATGTLDLMSRELTEVPVWIETLKHLAILSLGNNKLTSLKGVQFPSTLTRLDVSYNQLTSLEGVKFPPALTTLDFASNQLTSLEGVKFPPALTTLDFAANQLTSLKGVQFPPALTQLNVVRNQLMNFEGVHFPLTLTTLTFGTDQLTSLEGILFPPTLTTLTISGDQLSSLECTKFPTNLTAVFIVCAPMTSLAGIQFPPKLAVLYISQTHLTSLEGIQFPQVLHMLYISGNRLTTLKGVQFPPTLTALHVSNNQLTDLEGTQSLSALRTLEVDNNPQLGIPRAIALSGDPNVILNWYREARPGDILPELKIALLGEAEAGKTELRANLCDDEAADSTVRTVSWEWSPLTLANIHSTVKHSQAEIADLRLQVFDFGGQRELRSAHRFFLSHRRTIYVIVVRADRTAQENRLERWLKFVEHVHRQGLRREAASAVDDADDDFALSPERRQKRIDEEVMRLLPFRPRPPIVIVVTRCAARDYSPSRRDRPIRRSPELMTSVLQLGKSHNASVVAEYDSFDPRMKAEIERVRDEIGKAAAQVPEVWQEKYPPAFSDLVKEFRQRFGFDATGDDHRKVGEPFIAEKSALELIERKVEVRTSETRVSPLIYLGVLRDLGLLHWVGDRADVQDREVKRIVFNPRWIRGPVYSVLWMNPDQGLEFNELALVRRLCGEDRMLSAGVANADWPDLDHDNAHLILSLMAACELVVPIDIVRDHGPWYLVPDLLPADTEEYPPTGWSARWALGYIEDSFVSRLIGKLWTVRDLDAKVSRSKFGLNLGESFRASLEIRTETGEVLLTRCESAPAEKLHQIVGTITTAIRHITATAIDAEHTPRSSAPTARVPLNKKTATSISDLSQKQIAEMKGWWERKGHSNGLMTTQNFSSRLNLFEDFLTRCDRELEPHTIQRFIAVVVQAWRFFGDTTVPQLSLGVGTVRLSIQWLKSEAAEMNDGIDWLMAIISTSKDEVDKKLPPSGELPGKQPDYHRYVIANALASTQTSDSILKLKDALSHLNKKLFE